MMDEELKKTIDYFQYLPFKHVFEEKNILKAKERRKLLYDLIITLSKDNIDLHEWHRDLPNPLIEKTLESLEKFQQKYKDTKILDTLFDLKYVEIFKFRYKDTDRATIQITPQGWNFMELYEEYLENQKLRKKQEKENKKAFNLTLISCIFAAIAVVLPLLQAQLSKQPQLWLVLGVLLSGIIAFFYIKLRR